MRAVVLAHVDELRRLLHTAESGLDNHLRLADKGHDGAVCGLSRVYVEQLDTLYTLYFVGNLLDYFFVASFTEVGNALNDLFFLDHTYCGYKTLAV